MLFNSLLLVILSSCSYLLEVVALNVRFIVSATLHPLKVCIIAYMPVLQYNQTILISTV